MSAEQALICGRCGKPHPKGVKFCTECGAVTGPSAQAAAEDFFSAGPSRGQVPARNPRPSSAPFVEAAPAATPSVQIAPDLGSGSGRPVSPAVSDVKSDDGEAAFEGLDEAENEDENSDNGEDDNEGEDAVRPATTRKSRPGGKRRFSGSAVSSSVSSDSGDFKKYLPGALALFVVVGMLVSFWGLVVSPAITVRSLAGRWEYRFRLPENGEIAGGSFHVVQTGNKIQGNGADNMRTGVEPFSLKGLVTGDNVRFSKSFRTGSAIEYSGVLSSGQAGVTMKGSWMQGLRFGRKTMPSRTDSFEARLVTPEAGSGFNPVEFVQVVSSDPSTPDRLKIVLLLFIAGGVAITVASYKIFGHHGLLSIASKKQYIPSQFKRQHKEILSKMSRPLRAGGWPVGDRVSTGTVGVTGSKRLSMPPGMREENPHLVLVGQKGRGKSHLLASMIAHDIESQDRAVVVVDTDGTLSQKLFRWIAAHPSGEEFAARLVVMDPTKKNCKWSLNPVAWPEDGDISGASQAVVEGFKAVYVEAPGSQSQWNHQTANILRSCAVLLMACGKTLADVPALLSDNDFRDLLLAQVDKEKHRPEIATLLENWSNYRRLARSDQWITWVEPILNRIQPVLGEPCLRPVLTGQKKVLDLKELIEDRKILLVRLPQAKLGDNGHLVGSLLVSTLKQAALSLWEESQDDVLRPVALYLDELSAVVEKDLFSSITSETGKLQIGLSGTIRSLQSLPEEFRNIIVANTGTLGVFAATKKDADFLGPQMFRVDGRKPVIVTITQWFNRVNTTPTYQLIQDEEKLNIDRLVGQENRTYFLYRVGTVAGVFQLRTPDFFDPDDGEIDQDVLAEMTRGA